MSRKYWTKEETEILATLWNNPDITFEQILKVFKNRNKKSIITKAWGLGLKPRSEIVQPGIDREYLKKLLEVTEE